MTEGRVRRVPAVPTTEAESVTQYANYVHKTAQRFGGHGVPYEDLIQEGQLAVALAFRKWRPDGGASMLTWIRHPVRNAMRKLVERSRKAGVSGSKKPPVHLSMDERPLSKTVNGASYAHAGDQSLSLHETIGESDPERDTFALEQLPAAVASLNKRERKVIRARFVEGLTLTQTGEQLGVSRELVRLIQVEALKKLKSRIKRNTEPS